MTRHYLDNAATSFPKPPEVGAAVADYAVRLGASPGRGAYAEARETSRLFDDLRERLRRLLGGARADHVVFTLNASDALNLAIKGWLRPGDHVVTTHMEHNSVLRPLRHLEEAGSITVTRVPVDRETTLVDPLALRRALRARTRLLAVNHGSNVTGAVQPLAPIGEIARSAGVAFLVDAAQTAGHRPVDVGALGVDFLAVPGHKGLLGPLGTGALVVNPERSGDLRPLREGGTGSRSEDDRQPDELPDRLEAGSHNAIGLVGLRAAVAWLETRGLATVQAHERRLTGRLLQGLVAIRGVTVHGPRDLEQRVGVVSIRVAGVADPAALSRQLEERAGVQTRSGLHCAPLAHRTLGTDGVGGTTRLSLGALSTDDDVDAALTAVREVAAGP